MKSITVYIDPPVSNNRQYRPSSKRKGLYPDPAYQSWKEIAHFQLKQQFPKTAPEWDNRVSIWITIYHGVGYGNNRRDSHNCEKAAIDALVEIGYIQNDNDKNVCFSGTRSIQVEKGNEKVKASCEIIIVDGFEMPESWIGWEG